MTENNAKSGERSPHDEEKGQKWICSDCNQGLMLWSSDPDEPEDVACMNCGSLMEREEKEP